VFYAVVQHDFVAERPDELDAKAGDHISVVAQSNYEWFVAKPITRLGRPGLIPVSFVSIHDPATGRAMTEVEVKDIMERGEVPGVDDWKKSILDYKAASISLGVIEDENLRGPVPNSPFMPPLPQYNGYANEQAVYQDPPRTPSPPPMLPPGSLMAAEVVSWHFEMNEYWFRVNALYQPDDPSGSGVLPPAKQLVLFRPYSDFYDLQVNLLDTFPVEAGKTARAGEQATRILPYMPGPAQEVDDKVTNVRREELDTYLHQLCALWEHGAEAILRHQLIRDFFTPKSGDGEEDVEPTTKMIEERYGGVERSNGVVDEIQGPLNKLSIDNGNGGRYSNDSNYEEERLRSKGSISSQGRPTGADAYTNGGGEPSGYRDYERARSPYGQAQVGYVNGGRVQSPHRSQSSMSDRKYSAESGPPSRSLPNQGGLSMVDTDAAGPYTGYRRPEDDSPASYASSYGLSRSQSNTNHPPISATNSNPAFVKIKIFDRLTQDLIAIRVSPRVTHNQLMDKVRARLGNDVRHLAYRNSITNNFFSLDDDQSLKEWLDGAEKHVLYAD
jgi:bud emergence protein 1